MPARDHCVQCERFDNVCIKNQRCPINPELAFCDECGAGINIDELDSEDVTMSTEHEQFWGAPCSYQIVVGYRCPCCGTHNQL